MQESQRNTKTGLGHGDRLSPMEEEFCRLVATRLKSPREAMKTAGYAKTTIGAHGPSLLLKRPRVAKRIAELQKVTDKAVEGRLSTAFLKVESMVSDAFAVLADIMENGKSDAARERAARTVLEVGKGILLASVPKEVTFTVVMRDLYQEALQRTSSGEIVDIEGETVASPNK